MCAYGFTSHVTWHSSAATYIYSCALNWRRPAFGVRTEFREPRSVYNRRMEPLNFTGQLFGLARARLSLLLHSRELSDDWQPVNLMFICPCIANIISEYNQQDASFLNLFISVRRSTCFRRFHRPSSGDWNCTYSVRHLSDCFCYLLLAWTGSFIPSRLAAGSRNGLTCLTLCVQF